MKNLLKILSLSSLMITTVATSVVACENNSVSDNNLTKEEKTTLELNNINAEFLKKINAHEFKEQTIELNLDDILQGKINIEDIELIIVKIKEIINDVKQEVQAEFITKDNIEFNNLNLNLNLKILDNILDYVDIASFTLSLPIVMSYDIKSENTALSFSLEKAINIKIINKE